VRGRARQVGAPKADAIGAATALPGAQFAGAVYQALGRERIAQAVATRRV